MIATDFRRGFNLGFFQSVFQEIQGLDFVCSRISQTAKFCFGGEVIGGLTFAHHDSLQNSEYQQITQQKSRKTLISQKFSSKMRKKELN